MLEDTTLPPREDPEQTPPGVMSRKPPLPRARRFTGQARKAFSGTPINSKTMPNLTKEERQEVRELKSKKSDLMSALDRETDRLLLGSAMDSDPHVFQGLIPDEERRKVLFDVLKWGRFIVKPVKNKEELADRTYKFFTECLESGEIITWEKYILSLGLPKWTVEGWRTGRSAAPAGYVEVIEWARDMMAGYTSELAQQGKIDRTVYIFTAKNFFGMSERRWLRFIETMPLIRGRMR